ncbi:monovalent cation/H+ antiporter complex subunit F [Thiohalophilus sp.]|uniref:monovalent cation/H+ antiporter complex subunit F n=1 Tax=Thiohalophilus sp. TaxID=3028392 RepID=UPI002ACDB27F|nr:monovalent cation/H+ antiporter complex subunit F [Thiohalophilus sp.]MDZ7803916.1 monovalent cation/H+ antiporter complex subunit F [Thiohalophilus sp.]
MELFYWSLLVFLLLNLIAGLWRIMRGPSGADRMLAAQLFGTTTVAMLVVMAQLQAQTSLRNVALIIALLAAVTAVAFVRRAWPEKETSRDAD